MRHEFRALTQDESLTTRERISFNLQSLLDGTVQRWGLKVCQMETWLVDPPEGIKIGIHKQRRALE